MSSKPFGTKKGGEKDLTFTGPVPKGGNTNEIVSKDMENDGRNMGSYHSGKDLLWADCLELLLGKIV